MPEERKLVTVLFADIVGSTEMGLSHDPEVVRASLGQAFESASEILRAHGGTVEKFIGDAIMAVFGVPAAHDDDPDRAVRAAFALRDKITSADDIDGPPLRVRIGVNTGEAVAGSGETTQFLVTGPAVNAAARLQQAAAPGEIVVGELTHRLTAAGVDYGMAREIEAKGIGRLAAWPAERVVGDVPEQHRGLPGLRAPLIGRDHELRTLEQAYEGVEKDGRPHLLTVYGPAGSGKSRLTTEFFAAIGDARVRAGRCLPYGEGITYYAIQLIVRADAGIGIADPRDVAIEKIRRAAREAFGDEVEDADAVAKRVSVLAGIERADDALPEVRPDQLREELAFGLRRYLERRAASSPLVLIFEDVHWAEPGLLDLIEDLAEWSRAPLLLLCLARPDFREVRPAWGSAAANATALTLAPLSSDDTRRLIAALLAIDDLPEQVRSDVVTRAEGNPLYVEEFLRMLMESGRVEKRQGRWIANASIATVEVPPTLQGLIAARLDRVAPEVKALLQRASLAGRLFSTDALAALGDGAAPDAGLLRDAIRRDLLVEADESALGSGRVFRFKHVLIRDVAYATVPKAERSRLHDRYGRWLETSLGDRRHEIADIVAFHAEQAFVLAHELRPSGAADLGRRALDLLLEAAGSAYEREDTYAALNLYERGRVVADLSGATPIESAVIAGRIVLVRDALATARPAVDDVDAAIELARAAAPNKVLPELLALRAKRLVDESGAAAVRPILLQALDAARQTGDADLITKAIFEIGFNHYYAGEIADMRRLLAEAHEHVKRTGSKRAGLILFWLGRTAVYQGDLTGASGLVDESIAALPYKSKWFRAIEHSARAGRALQQGDPATCLSEARTAQALFREVGQPSFIASSGWAMGEAMLDLGDDAGARDVLVEALDLFTRRGQRGQIPEVEARLARALVRLGDLAGARTHAEAATATAMESDLESRFISAIALAEVREAEGDLAEADRLLRGAIAFMEPSGIGNALAETREQYARFLMRHGQVEEARTQLDTVRAFWSDPLAVRHRERIDALLRATQARTMPI
ncbi:MAG TPA: adenylate/guanylate cyclase domain-containing protein [Candidatus Limnocylindria bacterium]